jgi:hypothetical protein
VPSILTEIPQLSKGHQEATPEDRWALAAGVSRQDCGVNALSYWHGRSMPLPAERRAMLARAANDGGWDNDARTATGESGTPHHNDGYRDDNSHNGGERLRAVRALMKRKHELDGVQAAVEEQHQEHPLIRISCRLLYCAIRPVPLNSGSGSHRIQSPTRR